METNHKRVMVFMGTRPEGIKMVPVVRALQQTTQFKPIVCATAQHRALLDQVLHFFGMQADIDLDLMQENQGLGELSAKAISRIGTVLQEVKPDLVLVQGDTTTTFCAALAAFYNRIPVGHIEAGLRTWDSDSPFPEESFRQMVTRLSRYHFAPTSRAADNLRKDNVPMNQIFITGNTGIDALVWASEQRDNHPHLEKLFEGKKLILMTSHRRENFGKPLSDILASIRTFAELHPEFQIVYPVHPNPHVIGVVQEKLGRTPNISLIPPVGYSELVFLLRSCHLLLTDSGGLQEEAPTFGKPILVLRETTERPEAVEAGCAKLVGSNPHSIHFWLEKLSSTQSVEYQAMSMAKNPFGDGTAAKQIVRILEQSFFPLHAELETIQSVLLAEYRRIPVLQPEPMLSSEAM